MSFLIRNADKYSAICHGSVGADAIRITVTQSIRRPRRARRACSPLLLILRSLFSQFRPFFVGNRTLLPPFSDFSSLFRLTLEWPLSFVQIPGKCLSHVICRSSDSQNIRRLPAPSFCTRLTGHSSQISPSSKPTPRGKKKFEAHSPRVRRGRSTNKSTAI